jgi:hypothetical protein
MPLARVREIRDRYEHWWPPLFFVAGFLLDAATLNRIDDPFVLLQQALCIVGSAALVGAELLRREGALAPPPWVERLWRFRAPLAHFLLGTLLNSYTIFYFKSASALTSFIFLALLLAILLVTEFRHFGESQLALHMGLVALSVVSYAASLVPIAVGSIGTLPFLGSLALTAAALGGLHALFRRRLAARPEALRAVVARPFVGVPAVFALLYFLQIIPPVPLSLTYLGVFHSVRKEGGEYLLEYTRPWWKFWQHGDQTFYARPGDAIHAFARVYSPGGFQDRLVVRWLRYDPRLGWQASDAIPLPIVGGREEGFRGTTRKAHYEPGDWRVQVETSDGRELGRIRFEVVPDDSPEPRPARTERH